MTKLIVNNGWSRKVLSSPTMSFCHKHYYPCANLQLVQCTTSSKNMLVLAIWIKLGVMLVHYIVLDFVDYCNVSKVEMLSVQKSSRKSCKRLWIILIIVCLSIKYLYNHVDLLPFLKSC